MAIMRFKSNQGTDQHYFSGSFPSRIICKGNSQVAEIFVLEQLDSR